MIQEQIQNSLRRVKNDLQDKRLQQLSDSSSLCKLTLTNEILITIIPLQGAFANNTYIFKLEFPYTYPFKPPRIHVLTWVNHPNIDLKQQMLYVSILNESTWKPTFGVYDIVQEIKRTIVHIDLSYIPNTMDCIRSAQRMGKQDHSTDEEEVDQIAELNHNFRANFELDQHAMEKESDEDTEDEPQQSDQVPHVIDLQKQRRHFLEDQALHFK